MIGMPAAPIAFRVVRIYIDCFIVALQGFVVIAFPRIHPSELAVGIGIILVLFKLLSVISQCQFIISQRGIGIGAVIINIL